MCYYVVRVSPDKSQPAIVSIENDLATARKRAIECVRTDADCEYQVAQIAARFRHKATYEELRLDTQQETRPEGRNPSSSGGNSPSSGG